MMIFWRRPLFSASERNMMVSNHRDPRALGTRALFFPLRAALLTTISSTGGVGYSRSFLWNQSFHARPAVVDDLIPQLTTGCLLEWPSPRNLQCVESSTSARHRYKFLAFIVYCAGPRRRRLCMGQPSDRPLRGRPAVFFWYGAPWRGCACSRSPQAAA